MEILETQSTFLDVSPDKILLHTALHPASTNFFRLKTIFFTSTSWKVSFESTELWVMFSIGYQAKEAVRPTLEYFGLSSTIIHCLYLNMTNH